MTLDTTILDEKSRSLGEKFCDHIVSSTAQLAVATPVYATLETMCYAMDDSVSMDSRVNAAMATYCGVGFLVSKGRNLYRKVVHVSQLASEKAQSIHDSVYLAGFSVPYSLVLYTVSGETDWQKIGLGMGIGALSSLVIGPAMGYAMDAGTDLVGLKECKRPSYANQFGNLTSRAKKGVAALAVCGSLGLTALAYACSNDSKTGELQSTLHNDIQNTQTIEE
jgi:hypothetical protein